MIDLGGEPIKSSEYFENGRVTEFKYGVKLGTVLRRWNGEKMAYLKYVKYGLSSESRRTLVIYRITPVGVVSLRPYLDHYRGVGCQ